MNSPLRVLHVLNSPGGGATHCALDILRGLPRANYRPFLIVPSDPGEGQKRIYESLGADWRVVPMGWWNRKIRLSWPRRVVWSAMQNLQTWGHLRPVYQIAQCIRAWKVDLVHTHTGLIPWGAMAAKVLGVPHVWHIHEPNGKDLPFQYWMPDSLLESIIERSSDHVILVSRYVGELFRRSANRTPMTVAYQGVDMRPFGDPQPGKRLRESLGVKDDEVLVGMVAALTSVLKRHEVFVKMAAQLHKRRPRVRFAVFGQVPTQPTRWIYNGSYEYSERIRRLAGESGLSEHLILAGFHSDVAAIMNSLDILVHPSEMEGFGRVAVEAMAAGCPVIGSNGGGIAESVVDGETGILVKANDVDAFAEACEQLIDNPDRRRQMGAAGRQRAGNCFSTEEHIRQVTEIYDEVVRRRERA